MGKCYNVTFNSNTGSGAINNKTYKFDWGQLPKGKYKCCFSYKGKLSRMSSVNLAKVYLDIGQSNNYESTLQTSNNMSLSRFIGCLTPEIGLVPQPAIGTATISGSTLTITSMTSGSFLVGQYITSNTATITDGTLIIGSINVSSGGAGVYLLNQASTVNTPSTIYGTNSAYIFLACDTTSNPPFYLDSLPTNNTITCRIVNENDILWVDDQYATPDSYVLTLNMELLE